MRNRRTYTDEEKAAGLAAIVACAGDVSKAARVTDVPGRTLRRWRDETPAVVAEIARDRHGVATAIMDRVRAAATRNCAPRRLGRQPAGALRSCVYLVRCGRFHKVGVSSNLAARIAAMQSSCPFDIVVDSVITVPSHSAALVLEGALHDRWRHAHHRGEWFRLTAAELRAVRWAMLTGMADAALAA